MVAVHARAARAALRGLVRGGLVDRAAIDTPLTTTAANQEDVTRYVRGDTVKALLSVVGARETEAAAALGVEAEVAIKVPLSVAVVPGMRLYVTGRTAGAAWWRYVRVTGDLGLGKRLSRVLSGVDVSLSR